MQSTYISICLGSYSNSLGQGDSIASTEQGIIDLTVNKISELEPIKLRIAQGRDSTVITKLGNDDSTANTE